MLCVENSYARSPTTSQEKGWLFLFKELQLPFIARFLFCICHLLLVIITFLTFLLNGFFLINNAGAFLTYTHFE